MIILPFNDEQVKLAKEQAKNLGAIRNSILRGGGNFAGYLAELALHDYIGGDLISNDKGSKKYKYDLVVNGKRVEVKAKRRTKDPKPSWEASIADTSRHQTPDLYAFLSLTFDKQLKEVQKVWLCGFIQPQKYFQKAQFWARGDRDKSNGWLVSQNCWNLPYSQLFTDISKVL